MRAAVLVLATACRLDSTDVVIVDDANPKQPDAADDCFPRQSYGKAHLHFDNLTHTGESCIEQGCHGGDGGPPFSVAGTIFTDGEKGNPGVTMFAVPAGADFAYVATSDDEGNFYLGKTMGILPAFVGITVCPTTKYMMNRIEEQIGSCNACHNKDIMVGVGQLKIDGPR